MIVNVTQAATLFQAQSATQGLPSADVFLEALTTANQQYSQTPENITQKESSAVGKSSASVTKTAHQELEDYLKEYLRKGPIQLLREKILKKMDLTEDKLKAMPPEQRAAIEDEIAQKIKEYLLTHKSDQQQK
jgi:hypothetical protein